MKLYIAAPWAERDYARSVAEEFVADGHTITHPWWDHDVPDQNEPDLVKCARNDFRAILDADTFILLNLQERGKETSGKAVELGIALALRRFTELPIIFGVGIRGTNVFQLLPEVHWCQSIDEVREILR